MGELQIIQQGTMAKSGFTRDMFSRWIAFVDARPKTIATYTRAIRQFMGYLYERNISQPTREDVVAYREWLLETLKPTSVQAYLVAVKLFFKWAAQEGLYPNVADRVKGAKVDNEHKKDYLSSGQVKRLLSSIDRETLKGKRDYAMLCLMVTAGLRTIEVARANIEDMRPLAGFTALYVQGKGHSEKAAYVKVASATEDAIRDYLAARGATSRKEPLFASIAYKNKGEAMDTRSISRVAKERLVAAGFDSDRLTAHSLRHTAATLNLLAGASVDETQQLLRHKSSSTTAIYSHILERAKNNSEERIASAIFG